MATKEILLSKRKKTAKGESSVSKESERPAGKKKKKHEGKAIEGRQKARRIGH